MKHTQPWQRGSSGKSALMSEKSGRSIGLLLSTELGEVI